MAVLDWIIVFGTLTFVVAVTVSTKRFMRSVADFLAAGRCAGRYLLCLADGIAGLGAISVLAYFEMYYEAGFSITWWSRMMEPVAAVIAVSAWVIYRYRQTRVFTIGQLFEVRYSRKFRIFSSIMCFLSGIVNFGIFPAAGSRFFIHCCDLPQNISICGYGFSTFPLVMALLISISMFFVFCGGQITVLITDFVQGAMCNIIFIVMLFVLFAIFGWSRIIESLSSTPSDSPLLHPFHDASQQSEFNFWYILVVVFYLFYTHMAFQGQQGYNCSARTPHEAKMAKILGTWRAFGQGLLIIMLAVCAYTFMHHPDFSIEAVQVNSALSQIDNEQIQTQMTVPLALGAFLPIGIKGAFIAVMLAAFISTHDTYLHSWGSIFIQDVVMPLTKKELSPEQHIRWLRFSILAVAVFIFFFSLLFRQTEHIFMFFFITGAIYFGGAGAVIIGGLYWKKGTTPAAWATMITGSSLAVCGIVLKQVWDDFPLNGQEQMFFTFIISIIVYVAVSLVTCKKDFDMDRLLHRGVYATKDTIGAAESIKGLKSILPTKEFSRSDKFIYYATLAWTFGWFSVFLIGTVINLFTDVQIESWITYWKIYFCLLLLMSVIATAWLTIGGVFDTCSLFRTLSSKSRSDLDDGRVADRHDLDDKIAP